MYLRSIFTSLAGLVFGFTLVAWYLARDANDGSVHPFYLANPPERNAENPSVTARDVSAILYLDNILSVIQNYYYDDNLTQPQALLESGCRELDRRIATRCRIDGTLFEFQYGENQLSLSLPESFDQVVLARLILLMGEIWDSDAQRDEANQDLEGYHHVLRAFLQSLDPYSNLLSRLEYESLKQGTEGFFGGVGVVIGVENNVLTVIDTLPDTPAKSANVQPNDLVLAIDGFDTFGKSLNHLVGFMRGEPGTKIELLLLGDKDWAPRRISLERRIISTNPVQTRLEGGTLYVRVDSFTEVTTQLVERAVVRYVTEKPREPKSLILDLRSNPGGLLNEAVALADLFLPSGNIVSTKGRYNDSHDAVGSVYYDLPIVLLQNESSASASEIVAGALKAHDRATILGHRSYGKGSVQTVFELQDGKALKLTVARYFEPDGQSIERIGILPDMRIYSFSDQDRSFTANKLPEMPFREYLTKQGAIASLYEAGGVENSDSLIEISKFVLQDSSSKHGKPSNHSKKMVFSEKVANYAQKLTEKATSYLRDKHGIDWSAGKYLDAKALPLELSNLQTAPTGAGMNISVELTNPNPVGDFSRVAVLVLHDTFDSILKEHVIGIVKADSRQKVELQLPAEMMEAFGTSDTIPLRVGYSVDGVVVSDQRLFVHAQVPDRIDPEMLADYELVQEKGTVNGKLDPSEQATILVKIRNNGKVALKNLEANLLNLTGKQLQLLSQSKAVGEIGPGQSQNVEFVVAGHQSLADPEVRLGLTVKGDTLTRSYNQQFFVPSAPKESK